MANTAASGKATTVSCVLAVDGGERLAKDWPHLAVSYVTAILRQLSNVYPNADIQVAPMIINSLPPTSRQPLVVRPFRPVAQAMTELPGLFGGKGKQRESTSDLDYALLEGLLVASSLLESRQATHSYIILVSAQDIPNTNFWDEEVPGVIPLALPWPEIGPSSDLDKDNYNPSQGWQRLVQEVTKARTHFCTITTRFLPRLEDLQRKVAAANELSSQALPNLQHPEHAILLTGFQSAQHKRAHASAISESPRDVKENFVPPATNGPNKRMKLSPNAEARKVPIEQKAAKATKMEITPQASEAPDNNGSVQTQASQAIPDLAYLQQSPNKILMSLATAQGGSQGPMDASAVFQPQQQQIQELAQQPFSVQDIQQKREEVKSQMKQFLTSLSSMAKAKQFSMEQARAAAEQVRAEAVKKLQLLDRLEQQSINRSPSLSAYGSQTGMDGNLQQSPAAIYQQLQNVLTQNGPMGPPGGGANQSNQQFASQALPQIQQQQQHFAQQSQNPSQNQTLNSNPSQNPNQNKVQQQQSQQYPNVDQIQQQGYNQNYQVPSQAPTFPGHQRTASISSNTSSSAFQATPNQSYGQLQAPGSTTPTFPTQPLHPANKSMAMKQTPSSPSRAFPVWSGPIQWSLVDPQTKQKRELAFYVDAIPMRPNAGIELMNLQWPGTLEIAHISGMPMSELQKYASDNRIQVIEFTRAPANVIEQQGMSLGQNDSLYKLLAKSLEDKCSVATIKLPKIGQNRGIVVVALPGQGKLVGLLFLHTNLPPRTPSSDQSEQSQQAAAQRANKRSQEGQANIPPLPSPSFQQQNLQPFLQQMQMQSQLQQGQQQPAPNSLYSTRHDPQMQQQFNSPNLNNVARPQQQPANIQSFSQNGPNDFNFALQSAQAQAQANNNNNNNQQMSDAQFQELLASIQK